MRLQIKAGLLAACVIISACCSEWECKKHNRLAALPEHEVENEFLAMPVRDQISLYLWEMQHSHPSVSPYGRLLFRNGPPVAKELLARAMTAKEKGIPTDLLVALRDLPPELRRDLQVGEIKKAIDNCKKVDGSDELSLCPQLERDLSTTPHSP